MIIVAFTKRIHQKEGLLVNMFTN